MVMCDADEPFHFTAFHGDTLTSEEVVKEQAVALEKLMQLQAARCMGQSRFTSVCFCTLA
jgi:hypothetical protein